MQFPFHRRDLKSTLRPVLLDFCISSRIHYKPQYPSNVFNLCSFEQEVLDIDRDLLLLLLPVLEKTSVTFKVVETRVWLLDTYHDLHIDVDCTLDLSVVPVQIVIN